MSTTINKQHAQFINWIPPFLEVLKENGGSATTKEVREGIAKKMELSDEFLNERYIKSGQLKFNNQVYWAKQYLAWEGIVTVSKSGIWALTEKGLSISLNYDDALALFFKWVKIHQTSRKSKDAVKDIEIESVQEDIFESEIETEDSLPLIDVLKRTSPTGFEHLCGRLLREYNFEDIKITKRSHDGGIDGIAILKLNPFVNMGVYFQCKKYDGTVPIGHIREFIGVLAGTHGVDRGLFITTGTLPTSAYELERNNTRLELIDGEKLVEMFEKVELGITPRTVYDVDLTFFNQYMENEV